MIRIMWMKIVKSADELKNATQGLPFVLPHPLQRLSRVQNYDRGEMLFRRGDAASRVFFVYSGEVRMLRSGRAGEEILLHRAGPGEYFAEAAVDCSHYLCDAIASQASTLAVIPKAELAELIRNDGGFAMQWNSLLAHELRKARERIERLALSSVAERVRHFIVSNDRDSAGVALSGSLKDLARDLGVTHEALYRTLASMQKSGEVDRKGNILKLASAQRGKPPLAKEPRSARRGPDSRTGSRLGDRRETKV
jgi:CRP-like cAMP-binding protein